MTALEKHRVEEGLCPHCGSENLSTEEKSDYTKNFYSVYCECQECEACYTVFYEVKPAQIEFY